MGAIRVKEGGVREVLNVCVYVYVRVSVCVRAKESAYKLQMWAKK